MKIKIVKLWDNIEDVFTIKKGHLDREWMNETPDKYAYRCLPLNIANQHGWAVYPKNDIVVNWNGGEDIGDIKVSQDANSVATTIFGSGILTFHLPFLVRTEEDYSLHISGAPNHFVDGAEAMTGIFESDWAPYSFTMNWQLNMVDEDIVFTKNDPICFFFPIHRTLIEDFTVDYESFSDQETEFKKQYKLFTESRKSFLSDTNRDSSEWQKSYFKGNMPDGSKCPVSNHKTKLKLKE